MSEYDLGVTIFCLNEEKFIGYSIRSFLACKSVKCVAVVEGCVSGYSRDIVTTAGLSKDKMADIVRSIKNDRVVFAQMGFVNDKRELQNKGFDILQDRLGHGAICGLAGADELYHPEDLERVKQLFKANPNLRCLCPTFHHFWWRPDVVATGGNWNVKMHRWYRLPGQKMLFMHHAAMPTGCDKPKLETDEVKVFHYVGMADAPEIKAKLELYQKRDGHRLKVTDTWSKWKYGEPTQWTHGGGGVSRFDGKHPMVIADKAWDLTPRDAAGKKLPLPVVPWDEPKKVEQKLKIGVFLEGDRIPEHHAIRNLFRKLAEEHTVIVYPLDGVFAEAEEFGLQANVRGFSAKGLNSNDLVILFPDTITFSVVSAKHVAILWKTPKVNLNFQNYVVFEVPGVGLGYLPLPLPENFIGRCLALMPKQSVRVQPRREVSPLPPVRGERKIVPPPVPVPLSTPLQGDTEHVYIRNVTDRAWQPNTHNVIVRWWNGLGSTEVADAVRINHPLPRVVRPGETLDMDVTIPQRPLTAGFLTLVIDIMEGNQTLNVGPRIKKFLR